MRIAKLIPIIGSLLLPVAARAAGGHDLVGCSGCHLRKGGPFPVNTRYLDPLTNQPYSGTTAVCLACHQDVEKGGQGYAPIARHLSHPFALPSVNPKRAKVPEDMLLNGRFECMSCHDPHPSNANFKYLRVDVGPKGQRTELFCARCHPAKAG